MKVLELTDNGDSVSNEEKNVNANDPSSAGSNPFTKKKSGSMAMAAPGPVPVPDADLAQRAYLHHEF